MDKLSDYYNIFAKMIEGIKVFDILLINIILFLVCFLIMFAAFLLFKTVVSKKLRRTAARTKNELDDVIVGVIKDIKFIFFVVIALYTSSKIFYIGSLPTQIIKIIFLIFVVYECVLLARTVGTYLLHKYLEVNGPETEEGEHETFINGSKLVMSIILWAIGIMIILTNLGVKVSALAASLGVSSIAVAFALQSILADIFSSISIYFDRPFKVNDFIVVGDDVGTVKKIGIKTTRLKTLQGEELVLSNHELTSVRIRNFKQMEKRRIVFTIGVLYETPVDQLRKIPEYIKEIILAQDCAEFDRAHFARYGDFSLDFEIVYYVTNSDYQVYMDTQQSINLGLFEKFANEGIGFAYPTQTVYMGKTEE